MDTIYGERTSCKTNKGNEKQRKKGLEFTGIVQVLFYIYILYTTNKV